MKNTSIINRLRVYVQNIIATIISLFWRRRQTELANTGKAAPEKKQPASKQQADEIYWCHTAHHGVSPVPRAFLARGRSDTGAEFSVFQCSDTSCRQFVAAVIRKDAREKSWILFRGHNYRLRPEHRPNPGMRAARATLAVMCISVLLLGCGKNYKTIVAPDEGITKNSAVEIDGRLADGGKVRKIYVDATGHQVAEFTTGSNQVKNGTVRIGGGNAIDLRTDKATGEILASGTFIPIESQVAYIADKWAGKGLALFGIAAILAAIAFRRFLGFRAAAPFIPVLAALALALITAYCTHDFLVPSVQEFQAKIHASKMADISNENPQPPSGGEWTDKIRGIEKETVAFLSTPADNARLLAFLAVFVVALPVFAVLISWLFRKLACQPMAASLFLLLVIVNGVNGAPAKRENIEAAIRKTESIVLRAEELSADARRLDKAGLKEQAQTSAVRAYFLCDQAAQAEDGNLPEIDSLSAWGTSAQTKTGMRARFSSTAQRRATIEDALAEIAGATTNSLPQIYLLQRADVKNQIRAGDTDETRLLAQLSALAKIPQSLVRERVVSLRNVDRVTFEAGKIRLPNGQILAVANDAVSDTTVKGDQKTASDLADLRRNQAELQGGLAKLRRDQLAAANRPLPEVRVVVITNEVRVEKLVTAPVLPPRIEYITNTIVATVTNTTIAAAISPPPVEPVRTQPVLAETNFAPAETAADAHSGPMPVPALKHEKSVLKIDKTALYIGGLIVVVGFVVVASLMTTGRSRVLQIAENGKTLEPFEMHSTDDVLVLESVPRVGHRSQVDGKPSIRTTWRGSVLDPGNESVTVNDSPIEKPKILRPGDRFTAVNGETGTRTFDFLGCDQINEAVEA